MENVLTVKSLATKDNRFFSTFSGSPSYNIFRVRNSSRTVSSRGALCHAIYSVVLNYGLDEILFCSSEICRSLFLCSTTPGMIEDYVMTSGFTLVTRLLTVIVICSVISVKI